jgi:acetone carboxylase gamma subunit
MFNFSCRHCGCTRLMCHDSGAMIVRKVARLRLDEHGDVFPELADPEYIEEEDRQFVCDDCGHVVADHELAALAEAEQ